MTTSERLVRDLAVAAIEKTIGRTIRVLQAQTEGLQSGDDSGLRNLWDEICVQMQLEESFYWPMYRQTIESLLSVQLDRLSALELEAIWLQTDAAIDWLADDPKPQQRTPVVIDDVLERAFDELRGHGANWTNQRIRTYLERNVTFD